MEFLENVKLIQGGMGAYVSNWRLSRQGHTPYHAQDVVADILG